MISNFSFVQKIDELLAICFQNEKTVESDRGFLILMGCNPNLTSSLFVDRRLEIVGMDIVSKDAISYCVLGRLCSLLTILFSRFPLNMIESFGFVFKLMKHMYHYSVQSLFLKLLKNEEQMIPVQKWLMSIGFLDYLYCELTQYFPTPSLEEYTETEYYRIGGLFRIASYCLSTPNMDLVVMSSPFLVLCEYDYIDCSSHIESQKWQLILAYFTPEFAPQLLNFILPAVSILKEISTQIYEYHTYSILFLSQMLKHSPETEDLLVYYKVEQHILKAFCLCYQSSILMDSLRKLLITTMRKERLLQSIVPVFIPYLLSCAESDNIILRSHSYAILHAFESIRHDFEPLNIELNQMPEFYQFSISELKYRDLILELPYGETLTESLKRNK